MVNDSVSDLLTRIRNAQRRGQKSAMIRKSRLGTDVLKILKDEGMIDSFEDVTEKDSARTDVRVWLRYYPDGTPVMQSLNRISKPGRRLYARSEELTKVQGGLGIKIVSTSQGVMSDREARRRKIGGEVLAQVA